MVGSNLVLFYALLYKPFSAHQHQIGKIILKEAWH